MSETERETAGAVRSAHVAHFIPADWSAIAPRLTGALERVDRAHGEPQLLVIVPDPTGCVALARELRTLAAADALRILPATSAARAERLLKESPVHVVLGSAHTLATLLRASALKLDGVQAVVFAAADEFDAASDDLALVMAEVPKAGARLLTAATATPAVEELLERYLHRARRVSAGAAEPAAPPTAATIYARTVSADAPLAPLGELLDALDPPSTTIIAGDERLARAARETLAALGYADTSALVTIAAGDVAPNTALVVFAGLPSPATLATTVAARPVRMVALLTPRQRASLERMAGVSVSSWELSGTAREARQRDDALRAALRATLAAGLPTREVLALEPLLGDFDGLAVAAAALKLYESEKARADALAAHRPATRADADAGTRPPRESRDIAPPHDRPRFDRDSKPPRDRDFGGDRRPPRKFDRQGGPPRERTFGGERGAAGRPPRKFDRDGGPAARGGPARGGRDERPARGGESRPSRPFTRGPRRDDGGRAPRKEK